MNAAKAIGGVLTLCVTAPIWFYLLYHILVAVNASDVMFLLFWIYVPVGIVGQLCTTLAASND